MSDARPLRVLHIIDGLGGGGSERLLWDIVRLSDPQRVIHRVVTVYPDEGAYVYSKDLRQVGAYSEQEVVVNVAYHAKDNPATRESTISERLKQPLRPLWHAGRSVRNRVRRGLLSQLVTERETPSGSVSSVDESNGSEILPATSRVEASHDALLDSAKVPWELFEIVLPDAAYRIVIEYLQFVPDVVQGHTFHGFGLGLFLKLMFRRPMIFVVPALFSQLEDAGVGYLPEQYKQFHHGVDRFFTSYPAELLGIGVPAEKVVPTNVVVDLQEVQRVHAEHGRHRAEVRQAAGIPPGALVALSVGRLHSSKGHQYALEALALLVKSFPNLHWILVGSDWAGEREALETRARVLGIEHHVHLMGFIEEPLPFYAAADIYLRTVLFEGDNLSSGQAMAKGLPVVGFDTGRETELINEAEHGILVPLRDAEALAAAVQRILLLPDRGQAMGECGADYCRAHFDSQSLIDKLETVYSDLHQNRS